MNNFIECFASQINKLYKTKSVQAANIRFHKVFNVLLAASTSQESETIKCQVHEGYMPDLHSTHLVPDL